MQLKYGKKITADPMKMFCNVTEETRLGAAVFQNPDTSDSYWIGSGLFGIK